MRLERTQTGILALGGTLAALSITPWALAPILLLLIAFPELRDILLDTVDSGMRERNALLPKILIFLTPVVFYVLSSPPPPDDLLREMTASLHGFDYRNLYWASPRLMVGDTSYWYSRATGWLLGVLPKSEAYLPVQYALVTAWAVVLPLVLRKALRLAQPKLRQDFAWLLVAGATVTVWAFPGFMSRIVQARPENWGALIGTGAFLVSTDAGLLLWLAAMALFVPMYWLSFTYLPMALWMNVSWKRRLRTLTVLSLEFVAVWLSGLQGHWWRWFLGMPTAIAHRVVGVAEDNPEWHLLQSGMGWAILLLIVFAWTGRTRWDIRGLWASRKIPAIGVTFGLMLWFLVPDMVRYCDDLAPLLLVAVIQGVPEVRLRILDKPLFPALLLLSLFILVPSGLPKLQVAGLPNLRIHNARPGQRVLSNLGPGEYFGLYENPELRFAPADELGFTRRAVQKLGLDLTSGKTTCAALHHYRVRWVLARHITVSPNQLGRCLHLQKMDSLGYSIWAVTHG